MRIFLIRHGELNDSKMHTVSNHETSLSSRGMEQVEYTAEYLKTYIEKLYADLLDQNTSNETKAKKQFDDLFKNGITSDMQKRFGGIIQDLMSKYNNTDLEDFNKTRIKLYHSPYRKTRETSQILLKTIKSLVFEVKEDIFLSEKNHGIFDGLKYNEQKKLYYEEFKLFEKTELRNGKFYAKYPYGESSFDVAIRLRQFFQLLKEDENNGIQDIIIVADEIINRIFTMAWLNKTPEWYTEEKSPESCSIRVLEDNKDLGYIFNGYKNVIP